MMKTTKDRSSVSHQPGHFSRHPEHLLCGRLNGIIEEGSQIKLAKHFYSMSLLWAEVRGKIFTLTKDIQGRSSECLRNSRVLALWELLEGDNSLDGSSEEKSSKAPWNKRHFELLRMGCI